MSFPNTEVPEIFLKLTPFEYQKVREVQHDLGIGDFTSLFTFLVWEKHKQLTNEKTYEAQRMIETQKRYAQIQTTDRFSYPIQSNVPNVSSVNKVPIPWNINEGSP